jgi:hypothetical protein
MDCTWKPNWPETRQHFIDWWRHEGLLLGMWGAPPARRPRADLPVPPPPASVEAAYTDAALRAQWNHYRLAQRAYPADTLPIAETHLGPGSLALFLGAEPGFSPETVWFHPIWKDREDLESVPPLAFDPSNRWWQLTEETTRASLALSRGQYLVECPDLVENIDILAALRDPQTLLIDMLERPDWIKQKVDEINVAWFAAYDRLYELITLADGSSCFGAFRLWGPGKTAKVQCDAAAMISPAMFGEFVVPALTAQCAWLDHSMFHLDGHQCLCHLDALLAIKELDAIEWTPDPTVPSGGDPTWYPMYRRILAAGKSVQALGVKPEQVIPLLDAVGGKGMYILTDFATEDEAEALNQRVAAYR